MEKLIERYRYLLTVTDTRFVRYLYDKIAWNARLTGIVGARGVGKTTMLLQRLKLCHTVEDSIYVDAADVYFSKNTLLDFADIFHKNGGKYLFIDEIHKYSDWSRELKQIYDYYPDLQVVFTGSSILEIYRGNADLSRRALSYHLSGMSFREYLNMSENMQITAYSLDEILANKVPPPVKLPIYAFKQYLRKGYYPFFEELEFEQRLLNALNQTLENDIPVFSNMSIATARKLKQLLYVVSENVPFKPNINKLAQMTEVHRNFVKDYLCYMEKAGLILQLQHNSKNFKILEKVEKIYLNNPNLIYSLVGERANTGNLRETFFLNQMSVNHAVAASEKADFEINGITFEIGGKSKNQKQIENIENAYVVKDDIEYGYKNIVPLWAFGLNY